MNFLIQFFILLEYLADKNEKYALSWSQCAVIMTASALLDIGKVGVSKEILNKPGKLTAQEWEIIKTHTLIGDSFLQKMDSYQDEESNLTGMLLGSGKED